MTPAQAFRSDSFYTEVHRRDSHASIAAALPVSASGIAVGGLPRFAQDDVGALPPDRLAVAVLRGGRVLIFMEAAALPHSPATRPWWRRRRRRRRLWPIAPGGADGGA